MLINYVVELGLFHAWISLMKSCIIFAPDQSVLTCCQKFWACLVLQFFLHLCELRVAG